MGYFPATCGLSGLPIEQGDRVVSFLTSCRLNADPGLNGYISDPCSTLTLPLRGTYSGSGHPDLDRNYNVEIVEDRFGIPEWTYRFGSKGWGAFWSQMHRGDLTCGPDNEDTGIGLLMIRDDVLEHMESDPPVFLEMSERHVDVLRRYRNDGVDSFEKGFRVDRGQCPSGISLGVPNALNEEFPIGRPLFAAPPEEFPELLRSGNADLREIGREVKQDLSDPYDHDATLHVYGGMYAGMEREAHGASDADRTQFEIDKLEMVLVARLLKYAGRPWQAPPFYPVQFPDGRDSAYLVTAFADVARSNIGQSRYEADVTRSDLEAWKDLEREMKKRMKGELEEEYGPGVEVLDLDLDSTVEEVRFRAELPDGAVVSGTRSSEWVYDA